jgi:DNA-binding transcriptional regulator YhcF (GntR family)
VSAPDTPDSGTPEASEGVPGFGVWLREQRLVRGWAKPEMARRLHAAMKARASTAPTVTSLTRSIDGWEQGARYPQDRWQAVICEVLGIAPEDFPKHGTGTPPNGTAGLDPDDPSPWAKVARTLLKQIRSGELKPGAQMPSIGDTAHKAGVSAPTARRAYSYLKIQGILRYRPGTGYHVSDAQQEDKQQENADAGDDQTLRALRLAWGAEYGIEIHSPTWRAWRLDHTGEPITAPGPAELNAAIRADYVQWAVLPLLATAVNDTTNTWRLP